jgi:hypothetical protein
MKVYDRAEYNITNRLAIQPVAVEKLPNPRLQLTWPSALGYRW